VSEEKLRSAIAKGSVTTELLESFFAEGEGLDEVARLRLLAEALHEEPKIAGPFFKRLNPEKLAQAIDENRLDPPLISLAVRAFQDNESIASSALRNPRTPTTETLLLAERVKGDVLASLLRDELRLILSPDLARALMRNRNLEDEQQSQLERLLDRLVRDEDLKIRPEMRPESFSAEEKEILLKEPKEVDQASTMAAPKRRESIYSKLLKMTPAEKALLSLSGNREVRLMLARDPNQMVARAVLRSPRLSEVEVALIAQMRDIDSEILRLIALNRRWMRQYQIIKGLVLNPRTPIAISLSFIDRLNNQDIRIASKDHNLPNTIRKAAVRIAHKRGLR